MNAKDGGQAFPQFNHSAGLTVRDYFAAAAVNGMFGLISKQDAKEKTPAQIRSDVALGAYLIADAMLIERAKP